MEDTYQAKFPPISTNDFLNICSDKLFRGYGGNEFSIFSGFWPRNQFELAGALCAVGPNIVSYGRMFARSTASFRIHRTKWDYFVFLPTVSKGELAVRGISDAWCHV